jgi:hypothetical protein
MVGPATESRRIAVTAVSGVVETVAICGDEHPHERVARLRLRWVCWP